MEKLRKDLDKKVKHYDEALKAIPSGWDMVGQDFVEGKLSQSKSKSKQVQVKSPSLSPSLSPSQKSKFKV